MLASQRNTCNVCCADGLRKNGIDCNIDQYEPSPPGGGWPQWMEEQIEAAGYVLWHVRKSTNLDSKGSMMAQ